MASLLNMSSSRLVGSKVLPYDAEIEYLGIDENTGLTVIDTGYNPLDSTTFIIKAKFMLNGWVGSPSGYTPSILGNIFTTTKERATFWLRYGSDGLINFYHARSHPYSPGGGFYTYFNTYYTVIHGHTTVSVNGNSRTNSAASGTLNPSNTNIYLFKNTISPNPPYGKTRFCYFQVEDEGELKVDLIPCRVGNKGYMYDRVTNRFCTNIGTGEFILGPDKTN